MRTEKDLVKFTIYSKTLTSLNIVTSRAATELFRESITAYETSTTWFKISGRIDCIDSNEIEINLKQDDVVGFEITEINQMY